VLQHRLPCDQMPGRPQGTFVYTLGASVYTALMGKHLVDIDEDALTAARAKLGSATIKETVNRALRQAGEDHRRVLKRRLDSLADIDLADREQAWR
jgi:Arc/MetJ family transcription regulator